MTGRMSYCISLAIYGHMQMTSKSLSYSSVIPWSVSGFVPKCTYSYTFQGGLVVREAMIRLDRQAIKFDGITLNQCGIVFLGTPHSGTTEADWNKLLLDVSELALGVRSHAIVDQLASFNPSSVDSEEAFRTMPTAPPFHCFCEGEKTMGFGKNRTVSTSLPRPRPSWLPYPCWHVQLYDCRH